MHQQPRATEQPLALKIVSSSDQRSGVSGVTVSFIDLPEVLNILTADQIELTSRDNVVEGRLDLAKNLSSMNWHLLF